MMGDSLKQKLIDGIDCGLSHEKLLQIVNCDLARNTAEITLAEINQLDFNQRADLLRERGAPIEAGEIYFPSKYLVEVEMKKKISSPEVTWTYSWWLKDE